MHWRHRIVVALGLLAVTLAAHALDARKPLRLYSVTSWDQAAGLPNNTVQSLAQTPDGYLWIATLEGLGRFDGVGFARYDRSNTPAIPRNDIQILHVARDGTLWIGAFGGGLIRRSGQGFERLAAAGLEASTVVDMAEDPDGSLWVGTTAGLYHVRGAQVSAYTTREGLAHDFVHRLYRDRSGHLWIGTSTGLDRLEGDRFVHVPVADGASHGAMRALAEDGNGRLWVGTDRGVLRWDGTKLVADPLLAELARDGVTVLRTDASGALWVGTQTRLARLRNEVLETLDEHQGLPRASVTAVLEDREGSLWIGTNAGLSQIKDGAVVTYGRLQGLSADEILTVAAARAGGVWIGSGNGRVDRIGDGRVTPLPSTALNGSRVLALLDDSRGRLWAGTDLGLSRFERGAWAAVTTPAGIPREAIRSVLEARDGSFWISTDGAGLAVVKGDSVTRVTQAEGLPSNQLRALLEARDGTLWVATYAGLAGLRDGKVAVTYTTKEGLSHDLVRCLYEDADGTLWIGTYGGGLNRLKGGKLTSFTSRDGLYNDVVYAIAEDGRGSLWMSCNKGLFSVKRADLEAFAEGRLRSISSSHYGRSDGMASVEGSGGSPAVWKATDGKLWFPTARGVAAIDPIEASVTRTLPAPRIEAILLDGRPFAGARLEIGPSVQRVELDYATLSFSAPERIHYSFKMDGFDSDWNEAGSKRRAEYTRLPAGDHVFRVRASTAGASTASEASIPVHVDAYWWRTRPFYASMLGVLLVAVGLVSQWRVRALVARERELESRVEEAVARLKVLQGLLPICASCKKIRDDKGAWNSLEAYIRDHSEAEFTHGICPDCMVRLYPGRGTRARTDT